MNAPEEQATTAPHPAVRPALAAIYRSKHNRQTIGTTLAFVILALGAVMFIAPLVWMLSTALKDAFHVYDQNWIPNPAAWNNFHDALTSAPFNVYARNTVIITVLSTAGAVLSSSMVAYSFARLRWPGRDIWFGIVLATMLLPGVVTMIPQYILFSKIHWVNTFLPLIVPAW